MCVTSVLRHHGKVVVYELTPLHHHEVVLRVQLLQPLEDGGGHSPGVGQGLSLADGVCPGLRDAVTVLRWEESAQLRQTGSQARQTDTVAGTTVAPVPGPRRQFQS